MVKIFLCAPRATRSISEIQAAFIALSTWFQTLILRVQIAGFASFAYISGYTVLDEREGGPDLGIALALGTD